MNYRIYHDRRSGCVSVECNKTGTVVAAMTFELLLQEIESMAQLVRQAYLDEEMSNRG